MTSIFEHWDELFTTIKNSLSIRYMDDRDHEMLSRNLTIHNDSDNDNVKLFMIKLFENDDVPCIGFRMNDRIQNQFLPIIDKFPTFTKVFGGKLPSFKCIEISSTDECTIKDLIKQYIILSISENINI